MKYLYARVMYISKVVVFDYVSLIGHYNKLQHGPTIDPRIRERGYSDEAIRQLEEKLRSKATVIQSLNIKFMKPIEEFDYPQFGYVFTLYRKYADSGILPFQGALADQPAQMIELFNTIESIELEYKQRQESKQKAQARKKNGKS